MVAVETLIERAGLGGRWQPVRYAIEAQIEPRSFGNHWVILRGIGGLAHALGAVLRPGKVLSG